MAARKTSAHGRSMPPSCRKAAAAGRRPSLTGATVVGRAISERWKRNRSNKFYEILLSGKSQTSVIFITIRYI